MQVPSKDLRWAVGCILAEGDQTPDGSLLKTLQGQGYKTIKLPKADRVTMTTFPHKNLISIYLANYKVWNAYAVYAKVVRRTFSGRICLFMVFLCYFLFFFAILRICFSTERYKRVAILLIPNCVTCPVWMSSVSTWPNAWLHGVLMLDVVEG